MYFIYKSGEVKAFMNERHYWLHSKAQNKVELNKRDKKELRDFDESVKSVLTSLSEIDQMIFETTAMGGDPTNILTHRNELARKFGLSTMSAHAIANDIT